MNEDRLTNQAILFSEYKYAVIKSLKKWQLLFITAMNQHVEIHFIFLLKIH